jgi:hypothetical protein
MEESFAEIRERKRLEFEANVTNGKVIDLSGVLPWWVLKIDQLKGACNMLYSELIESEEQIKRLQKQVEELERYTGQC